MDRNDRTGEHDDVMNKSEEEKPEEDEGQNINIDDFS